MNRWIDEAKNDRTHLQHKSRESVRKHHHRRPGESQNSKNNNSGNDQGKENMNNKAQNNTVAAATTRTETSTRRENWQIQDRNHLTDQSDQGKKMENIKSGRSADLNLCVSSLLFSLLYLSLWCLSLTHAQNGPEDLLMTKIRKMLLSQPERERGITTGQGQIPTRPLERRQQQESAEESPSATCHH